MEYLVSDIIRTVKRVLDYPISPANGITVASLLVLIVLFRLVIIGERVIRRHFVTRVLRRTQLEPAFQFTLARVIGCCVLSQGSGE